MQVNFVLVCVAVAIVHVDGGCVEEPFKIHGYLSDKEARDLKDVEMISKDLKFKLDHGLNEKELMEKTLKVLREHLLGEYQTAEKGLEGVHLSVKESKVDEENDFLMKALHGMLGPDFKKEDISEEELKAVLMFLKSLTIGHDEKLFPKKDEAELHKEVPAVKLDEELLKLHGHSAEKGVKVSEEKFKDFETHLAESVLHMLTDKDAETYLYGDKEALDILKKLDEGKVSHDDETVPYFLMPDGAKAYSKGIAESGKHAQDESQLKIDAEKEALKKIFSLLRDAFHRDGSIQMDKEAHSIKASHAAEGIPKVHGSLKTERAVSDMKALADHKTHLQEGAISHEKDLIFDDILKKEEVHTLDEEDEIFHEYGKVFEGGEKAKASSEHFVKSLVSSGEEGAIKASGFEKAKKDSVKAEEAKSAEDILKEDGYYITRGTHAYEKARDQAHEDAKVSLNEEAKKKNAASGEDHIYDHKFLNGEEGLKKVVHRGIDEKTLSDIDKHLYDSKSAFEGTLKLDGVAGKEETKHDASIAHGDDVLKAWKDSEFAKGEEKSIYGSGLGFGDEHIKGIKTDEDHLLHDVHSSVEDHHLLGSESADEDKSHGKAHGLKNKFLSALRRVLNLRKCHLVTMRPGELLGIVDCISRSKDPMLCEKFAMCEKKRPVQVILASEKCQMETIPGEVKRCTAYEPLFPSRDIPLKIFKCVVKNTHELTPVEKKQMMEFEECARQLKVESCGRIPWG